MEHYTFAASLDLDLPVAVKVNRLEGHEPPLPYSTLLRRADLRHRGSNLSANSELYVTIQPFADSKPLTVECQTAYKHFKNGRVWNQWLSLPINYSALPVNVLLAITIWDLDPISTQPGPHQHHIPFGGTTIPLFDENATLRTGRQKCQVWRHRRADGFSDGSTPWQQQTKRRRPDSEPEPVSGVTSSAQDRETELDRLVDLMKKHEMGEITENKWLDQMVFRHIEKLERQHVRESIKPRSKRSSNPTLDKEQYDESKAANFNDTEGAFFLFLEFPRFDHPIVFTDHEYPPPPMSNIRLNNTQASTAVNFKPPPEVQLGPGIQADGGAGSGSNGSGRLIRIYDPEIGYTDNPAETKHRRLIRGQRNALDRDLKPNPKMRDFLNRVMSYGPTVELSEKEKDEVWRFRHHLTRDKRALTKFVKSVNWAEASEARQAIALLPKWSEIDVDDALELLAPWVHDQTVRAYAVDRLRKADDDELLLYLLQLVQALKFESRQVKEAHETDLTLASFLIARCSTNLKLANFLHWYLMVQLDEEGTRPASASKKLYARVSYDFMKELESSPEGQGVRKILLRQAEFITILSNVGRDIKLSRTDRNRKVELLRKTLADPKNEMITMSPALSLPLDPEVKATGIIIEECSVFKSSLYPLKITFRTEDGGSYPMIFKVGDDLRQDQLVIQIIALMDRLLLKENLDLKLTPYGILATSISAGAVQFVDASPLSNILQNSVDYKNSILGFLRFHAPAAPDSPSVLGVRREVMDNYVKSVAGYSVVTYLLGVGDRHLDNLLLGPDGRFLHIDFGYILGRDPKPMAPLMKLSKEMVDGMGGSAGGPDSQFEQFRQYCFTAYTTLRRSSSLILNLFALMQDANIPGLSFFGADSVRKVEERFKLYVSEEEAINFFAQLIDREMTAWGGVLIDKLHGFAQGWRA